MDVGETERCVRYDFVFHGEAELVHELGGEVESSGEANDSINAKLPIALLIIILLLVGQFDSLRRPDIILLTIPLGLIGTGHPALCGGRP